MKILFKDKVYNNISEIDCAEITKANKPICLFELNEIMKGMSESIFVPTKILVWFESKKRFVQRSFLKYKKQSEKIQKAANKPSNF